MKARWMTAGALLGAVLAWVVMSSREAAANDPPQLLWRAVAALEKMAAAQEKMAQCGCRR